jgi:hypothetical protein
MAICESSKKPKLVTWPAVPAEYRSHVRWLIRVAPRLVRFAHHVNVYLLPAAFWQHLDTEDICHGQFYPAHGSGRPSILLAGVPYHADRGGYLRGQNALDQISDAFWHECVHYTQFRDGKPQNERGVNQRAAALMRKAAEYGH